MVKSRRNRVWRVAASVSILFSTAVFLAPVAFLAALSLKTGADVYGTNILPSSWTWGNFPKAWSDFGLAGFFGSSVAVTGMSVTLTIVLAICAAYAFVRLPFRGSKTIFVVLQLGIMIPPAAVVVPVFVQAQHLRLYDTHIGLALVYAAFGLPIATLILHGFFVGIPHEMIEAARIDGASELAILRRLVVPMSKSAIATVAILLFLFNWNEFLLALVLLRDADSYTLPVGIAQFIGQYNTPYELVAAAVLMAGLPVFALYLVLQRQFEKGIAEGALKG